MLEAEKYLISKFKGFSIFIDSENTENYICNEGDLQIKELHESNNIWFSYPLCDILIKEFKLTQEESIQLLIKVIQKELGLKSNDLVYGFFDDVAITEAYSLDDAITFFKSYYNNANNKNVKIIDCNTDGHKEGWVKGIMIVSKY